jgi:single-stranded DNA-specific DHH superfamily exonuclease
LAQGHNNAFGVSIFQDNVEQFQAYANDSLAAINFEPLYKVDFIFDARRLTEYKYDLENLIQYEDIWGQEVKEPFIAVENIVITKNNIQHMKGTTLKIIAPNEPGVEFVKFKVAEEEFETLCPSTDLGCVTIDVIGVCERNSYNDRPQIIIKDYFIKDRQSYYF